MPFGIYLHVPFCRSKCAYCDFYSVQWEPRQGRRYLRALKKEIEIRAAEAPDGDANSLYVGGGTPSLLSAENFREILDSLSCAFRPGFREMTLEANPCTVGRGGLERLRRLGFDRLSLGAQSFQERELSLMGRTHTAIHLREAFRAAREAGFENVGIDLIYGIPEQRMEDWDATLEAALSLEPQHVSVYELTLSPSVPLAGRLERGELRLPGEAEVVRFYQRAVARLGDAGLDRYEISNFARPGFECRHHRDIWRGGAYLGFGPAAHSFSGKIRSHNVESLEDWAGKLETGTRAVSGSEVITDVLAHREQILLGLRTRKGIPREILSDAAFGQVAELSGAGWIEEVEGRIRLSAEGVPVADEIIARLI